MRLAFYDRQFAAWGKRYAYLPLFLFTSLIFLLSLLPVHGSEVLAIKDSDGEESAQRESKLKQHKQTYLPGISRIRVALIENQAPLSMVQADEPKGYLNDVILKIAGELGLEVQFIPMNYAQSVDALLDGSIDVLNDYSHHDERSSIILETPPVMTTPYVAVGGIKLPPIRSMADLAGKTLVAVKGFQQTMLIQERYPEYKLILVDNISEAYHALRSKTADIYVDNAMHAEYYLREHMISDLRILGRYPEQELGRLSLRIAVNKRHPMLHLAIIETLEQLKQSNELDKLKAKWLISQYDTKPFLLTGKEQDWLQQHPEIRVVLDPGWAPVEYRNDSGQYDGISLDYLSRIEAMLGTKIHIVKGLDWQQGVEALKEKRADMFASVARTPQRETYLKFTHPYIYMPIRIFSRDDVSYIGGLNNLHDKRIAVVNGYAIQDWLNTDYPHLNIVPVETPVDGLTRVAKGDIDVFIGNIVTANYYIKKYELSNIREVGDTPYSNSQTMAVRDDWPLFAGILQKALDAIPEAEKTAIFNRWMSIKFERTINYTLLWWVLLIALITILGFVYWNRQLDREVARHTHDLAESESRFRNFFEKNSSVMMLVDPEDGNIVEANLSAASYYGYPVDNLIGKSISKINMLSPQDIKKELYKAKTEKRNHFQFQHKNASGEVRDVEVYSTPISSGNRVLLFSIVHDVTDRKRAEQRIAIQAHYDALTGLPNRVLALDRLAMYQKESDREQTRTGVMFIDLDDFKKINDTLGHDVGDMLLVDAGTRIRTTLRDIDTVGRLGGDEFIVLVGQISNQAELIPIAEKLLEKFKEPFSIQKHDLVLTASIGISVYPDDGKDANTLLKHADSAMYHAKEQGRSMYAFFTDEMNHKVSRRLNLEEQMNGALERGEFTLHYQPKIALASGKILGVEALLRWDNPVLGSVSPNEFIPVAEQTGLIVNIGEFVINEALQFIGQCRRTYDETISVAVNLSPRQFREPGLLGFLLHSIEASGLPWDALELEITEGVLMTGLSYIEDAIATLSQRGVVLAMDDFGTGYSSLSYLRHYPFNVLKIDRSFVNGITDNYHDLELVSATIAMGHNLGMVVIAEGVETEEQLATLRQHGCDIAQGYYFSKAVPPERLLELLARGIQHNV